ncbi:MAG: GAF domain-containing sensor histidine kinase [Planctomycetes bacterium]|nr:GAF domain-containing sensor histidine kinase [Planctomycetota bacterium]
MKEIELKLKIDTLMQHVAEMQSRAGKDDAKAMAVLPTTLAEMKALIEDLIAAQKEMEAAREAIAGNRHRHQALKQSHKALKNRVQKGDAELAQAGAALQAEISEHARTEANLAQRQAALEAVYQIATTRPGSTETFSDRVVLNLSKLLKVPGTVIYRVERNRLKLMSSCFEGTFTHEGDAVLACGPCAIVCREKLPHQSTGTLKKRFPDSRCFRDRDFNSYIGVPVMDSADKVTGILCAMDYGERHFSEGEIHLIEILSRYVANEFERKATERQLVESKRFQVLGQLTSGVAHEVRNPINAILILSEALEARLGEATEYAHYLERIRTQVKRLSDLMQDLLDLGKPLQLSRLDQASPAAILEEARELWQQSTAECKQTLRMVQPDDFPDVKVLCDKERLKQVFINFIENAVQHSPENSEIVLSILPLEKENLRIRLIDQGCGIPPAFLSRVFEPFFTARKKGTGLGLSLAKQIVEAHRGEVSLWNNDPPPGCTVEVCLPVAKEKGL